MGAEEEEKHCRGVSVLDKKYGIYCIDLERQVLELKTVVTQAAVPRDEVIPIAFSSKRLIAPVASSVKFSPLSILTMHRQRDPVVLDGLLDRLFGHILDLDIARMEIYPSGNVQEVVRRMQPDPRYSEFV